MQKIYIKYAEYAQVYVKTYFAYLSRTVSTLLMVTPTGRVRVRLPVKRCKSGLQRLPT